MKLQTDEAQCGRRSIPKTTNGSNCPATARRVSPPQHIHLHHRSTTDSTVGTIGISEYAANALGDVVFVELPALDLEVSQGDSIGAVESVKSASDIMTPVSGKIIETNNALEEKPGTINKSPEGDGWLAKIEVSNAAEIDELMDAEGYKQFTEEADSH